MNSCLVSIVIPTHKRTKQLRQLLRSLFFLDDRNFEILVVSNLNCVKTERIVNELKAHFKRLVYLFTGQIGVNRARNLGIQHCKGAIIQFFDDDCRILRSDHLTLLRDLHNQNPDICAIGGPYVYLRTSYSFTIRTSLAYHAMAEHWLRDQRLPNGDTLALLGGNVSYKSKLLFTEGFKFSESIKFGGAETEFHLRLSSNGKRLKLFDQLAVEHRVHITPLQLIKKGLLQGRTWGQLQVNTGSPSSLKVWKFAHRLPIPDDARSESPGISWVKVYQKSFSLGEQWGQLRLRHRRSAVILILGYIISRDMLMSIRCAILHHRWLRKIFYPTVQTNGP